MRRVALVMVVLLATARPARADLAGAFYDDVRDVVEELIKTEVTTSVVAQIEQRSPALAFYLHGTLERLGSPYWGSLSRVLKDDLTIAVSDFVYWHLATGGADGDIIASAKRFFGCVASLGDATADPACKRLIAAVHDQRRPLLEVECRRQKPPPELWVACDIGLAVKAALERRGEVRHHIVDALADIVLSELKDRGLANRLRDVLVKWLDLPKDLPTPLLEALANPDLADELEDGAIDKTCADPKTLEDLFQNPSTSHAWLCFAVTHPALPAALAAKVTIADHGNSLDLPIDFWVIEAALKEFDADRATDDSSFRMLAELAFDARCPAGDVRNAWPCKGARLTAGATVTIAWQGRQLVGTVDKNGQVATSPQRQMLNTLLRFRKAMRRIEELRALVPPSLASHVFYAGSTPPTARTVIRSIARMARLVVELRSRWYLWASDGGKVDELDIAALLHVAMTAVSGDGPPPPALAFLDKHAAGGGATIDIGDWLRLVMRGDYRSLAMESLRSALNVRLTEQGHPREKFFLTLAAYLLDNSEASASKSRARRFAPRRRICCSSRRTSACHASAIGCGCASCRASRSSSRSTTPTPSPTEIRAAPSSPPTGRR